MRIEIDEDKEKYQAMVEARKHGELVRRFIQEEVRKQLAEQMFDLLKDTTDRDIRIYHMMAQMDSMEKSVKDINKKFTAIRKQLRETKAKDGVQKLKGKTWQMSKI